MYTVQSRHQQTPKSSQAVCPAAGPLRQEAGPPRKDAGPPRKEAGPTYKRLDLTDYITTCSYDGIYT